MGVEWRHFLDRSRFVRIESEGAMGGRSNGYMQILLGGGYRWSITPLLALDIMAGAGVAGGGRVDTGGGLLLDAQLGLVTQSKSGYFFELSIGHVWAPQASFKAHSASARIGRAFAVPKAANQEVELADLAGYSVLPLRIRAAHQMYSRSNPRWRTHHADLGFNNLGAQVDYFPTAWLFLTGQGLAAYSGKAGAYMIGLLGLGIHLGGTVFAEAEALIGAAGGGGAAVGGGLVRQVNAGIGLRLNETTDIVAKVGRLEAFHGRFQARVWGLSLGYRFATFTRSPQ
ncbi:MAG: hypothetical protein D6771_08790 [Zetaproteobacteria bacterium]|nr:MAG: hypothetical protein D6771_08790 [Zetaproteobacteria bacterium]